jgi:hypothetical protein
MELEGYYPASDSVQVLWTETHLVFEENIVVCQLHQIDLFDCVPVGHGLRSTKHLSELAVVVGHLPVIPTGTMTVTHSVSSLR